MAFRIWSTTLFGGLLGLWILTIIQSYIDIDWILLPALISLAFTFVVIGRLSTRYGLHQVKLLVDEATIWERAGRHNQAESAFNKAVAVYNSFLISPKAKKKNSVPLIAQMARFYLACAEKDYNSQTFILSYLAEHPDDSELAEDWLFQIGSHGLMNKKYQDVANRINQALPEHVRIQQLLARFYLSARRNDFLAQQTYRRVLAMTDESSTDIIRELASIFLLEGRSDEWALEIYLKSYEMDKNSTDILNGIAACVYWIPKTDQMKPEVQKAWKLLTGMDEAKLASMRDGFKPPIQMPAEKKVAAELKRLSDIYRLLQRFTKATYQFIKFVSIQIVKGIKNLYGFFKASKKSKIVLKWSVVGGFVSILIFMIINTIGYLVKASHDGKQHRAGVEAVVTDPFTLQVAAYLKPEHADKYVSMLKKHNIDAYWTEAVGKKKKWYKVRVSHFPDKKSAIEYGELLKSKGLIDDFYVANY